MKIFTVRHGQTDWNIEGRLQGHTDIPLNPEGLDQAERVARRLSGEKVDAIYTSDLSRAFKTAEAINQHHNAKIISTPALREASFGKWEGQNIDLVRAEVNWEHPDPDGEDKATAFNRIHTFLETVVKSGHENIVIVGHYGSVTAAICYFLDMSIDHQRSLSVGNTAVHCFQKDADGKFRMKIENDMSHLDG
ncbi:MAG: histidine phosphatase family protein [Defluviitaleaceae bacterium]|nr:histidine phosphatase family protein [Defluviitaleaceae bacterium]